MCSPSPSTSRVLYLFPGHRVHRRGWGRTGTRLLREHPHAHVRRRRRVPPWPSRRSFPPLRVVPAPGGGGSARGGHPLLRSSHQPEPDPERIHTPGPTNHRAHRPIRQMAGSWHWAAAATTWMVVPVAWTSVLHLMRDEPLPEYLPPYWVEIFVNVVGSEPYVSAGHGDESRQRDQEEDHRRARWQHLRG